MKNPVFNWCVGLAEQVVAFVLLVSALPALIGIGFILRAFSDEPVLLTDELRDTEGTIITVHRFRTTGRGNEAFQVIGRFLRRACIDDFPAIWDVARGEITFWHLSQLSRK